MTFLFKPFEHRHKELYYDLPEAKQKPVSTARAGVLIHSCIHWGCPEKEVRLILASQSSRSSREEGQANSNACDMQRTRRRKGKRGAFCLFLFEMLHTPSKHASSIRRSRLDLIHSGSYTDVWKRCKGWHIYSRPGVKINQEQLSHTSLLMAHKLCWITEGEQNCTVYFLNALFIINHKLCLNQATKNMLPIFSFSS